MKKNKSATKKHLFLFVALMMFLTSFSMLGDDLPKGVTQVITAVEGNITYYVKEGDKVKKGDPLFFVVTTDNNPAIFFQILHKIYYYELLYLRRDKLVRTKSVSREDYDTALNNLILAKDDLVSYICKVKIGFYTAPFDCEVVNLLYPNTSGIGDGNPAINIKPADPNYKFVPVPPNEKITQVLFMSDNLLKEKTEALDVEKVFDILKHEEEE